MKVHELLSDADLKLARSYLKPCGKILSEPDLVIAPDGEPYLYRWHLVPRNATANIYFHIQVADDPARPLHDHPWDNTSIILAGSYEELIDGRPMYENAERHIRRAGDMIHRRAEQAHRLLLPEDVPYMISLFVTGRKKRDWGFWVNQSTGPKWFHQEKLVKNLPDGRSLFTMPKDPNR